MKQAKQRSNPFRKRVFTIHLTKESIEQISRLVASGSISGPEAVVIEALNLLDKAVRIKKLERRLKTRNPNFGLAVALFRAKKISAGKAAKIAGMIKPRFVEMLGLAGVTAVDYPSSDLDAELAQLGSL